MTAAPLPTGPEVEISLEWIDLAALRIPPYQRPEAHDIDKLVARWDIRKCGALIVSWRDGCYWTVDGQTRGKAARRCGLDRLPAIVVHGLNEEEEADLFLAVNCKRLMVNAVARHNAEIVARHPRALAIAAALGRHNLVITSSSRGSDGQYPFNAVVQVEHVYDDGGVELIDRTLRVIAQAWPEEIKRPSGAIVRGVGYFLARDAWDATDERVAQRLTTATVGRLHELAAHARELAGGRGHGGGSPIYVARGVAAIVYGSRGAEWAPRRAR
jgi:hypothetical protein